MSGNTKKQSFGNNKITLKISEKKDAPSPTKYRARWISINDLIKIGPEIPLVLNR